MKILHIGSNKRLSPPVQPPPGPPRRPPDTKIRRFCNFLLLIGKTGQTRFGAGNIHSNGSAVTHFPKYRQYGVRTAHTRFWRCEHISALGALEGCSTHFLCRTMRCGRHLWCSSARAPGRWQLQTSAHSLEEHTSEVRKIRPSNGLFRQFGRKNSKNKFED